MTEPKGKPAQGTATLTIDLFPEWTKLAAKLNLPRGFYDGLLKEDDWSFVIKLSALIEAACTHALVARLHAPELTEALSWLDLGSARYGKVKLLRELGVVTGEQREVLKLLYEIRNLLAHDIRLVNFSFASHLAGLKKKQRENFLRAAGLGVEIHSKRMSRDDFVAGNPKLALWITFYEIIACLVLEEEVAKIRLEQAALRMLKKVAPT